MDANPCRVFLCSLLCYMLTLCAGNDDAKRLYHDLLLESRYNKLIRPVGNNTDKLIVRLGIRLSQLIDVVSLLCLFIQSPLPQSTGTTRSMYDYWQYCTRSDQAYTLGCFKLRGCSPNLRIRTSNTIIVPVCYSSCRNRPRFVCHIFLYASFIFPIHDTPQEYSPFSI